MLIIDDSEEEALDKAIKDEWLEDSAILSRVNGKVNVSGLLQYEEEGLKDRLSDVGVNFVVTKE